MSVLRYLLVGLLLIPVAYFVVPKDERLSDEECEAVSGGGCGWNVTSGYWNCTNGGTVLCGSEAVACSSDTVATLIPVGAQGAGSEVPDTQSYKSCKVCLNGVMQCGGVLTTTKTKQCLASAPGPFN